MRHITSLAPDRSRRPCWSMWPELAHGANEILLLSATPVRSNETAFLDLLHLLDPKNYQPQDLEAFIRRVEMRDQIALTHYSLTPDLERIRLSHSSLTNLDYLSQTMRHSSCSSIRRARLRQRPAPGPDCESQRASFGDLPATPSTTEDAPDPHRSARPSACEAGAAVSPSRSRSATAATTSASI